MTKRKVREPSRVYVEVKWKCARCGGGVTTSHMRPPEDSAELDRWLAAKDIPQHCPGCNFMYGAYRGE
ncbi:MAG: hypothetical protein ACXWPI_00060 [Ktedonobacterales bacterium]